MDRPDRPSFSYVLALTLAALLAAACSEQGETISEAERGESEGTVFKVETGGEAGVQAEFGERVKLPANFPRDIPIYPGATPQGAVSRPDEGMVVNLRSQDSPEEVYDFYATELEAEGWKLLADMNLGAQRMLTAEKGQGEVAMTIMGEEGGTVVVIALTEKR
jgi:hypothetical protein